jgi:hypothetical protein
MTKKFYIVFYLYSSILYAFDYKTYGALHLGNYDSSKNDFIAGFGLEAGVKNDKHKIYLSMPNIYFNNQFSEKEIGILMYSLNYDFFIKNLNQFYPYIGAGLNYSSFYLENKYINNQINTNLQFGILYKFNKNFSFNIGIRYFNINYINDILGEFISVEFNL